MVCCLIAQGQNISPEQAAFDYFCTSVYVPMKGVKWSFSGMTDTMATSCISGSCFEDGGNKKSQLEAARTFCTQLDSVANSSKLILLSPIDITQSEKYVRIRLRWLYQKHRLKIYRQSVLGNKHFVMIELVSVHQTTDRYLFDLDDNQKIIRWCLRSDIW